MVSYADAACTLGDSGRVLPFLWELAAADPLDERVHARLMIALAGTGQQAAALGVYERLSGRLDRELGVRPGAELAAARQRVLRQELPVTGVRIPSQASSRQREPSPSRRAGSRVSVCPGRVRTRP
jgi:DNA-binding SARP family transcriptional activator